MNSNVGTKQFNVGDKVYVATSGGMYPTRYGTGEIIKKTPSGLLDVKRGDYVYRFSADGSKEIGKERYHSSWIDTTPFDERTALIADEEARKTCADKVNEIGRRFESERVRGTWGWDSIVGKIDELQALLNAARAMVPVAAPASSPEAISAAVAEYTASADVHKEASTGMSRDKAEHVAKAIWEYIDSDVLDIPNSSYLNGSDDEIKAGITEILLHEGSENDSEDFTVVVTEPNDPDEIVDGIAAAVKKYGVCLQLHDLGSDQLVITAAKREVTTAEVAEEFGAGETAEAATSEVGTSVILEGRPRNHQELFEENVGNLSVITDEFSSDTDSELAAVRIWAEQYAAANGLRLPAELLMRERTASEVNDEVEIAEAAANSRLHPGAVCSKCGKTVTERDYSCGESGCCLADVVGEEDYL